MSLRSEIATLFARHAFALTNSTDFQALESGQAAPEDYTRFIGNVVRTHLKLPPLRAFLFTLAPPDITAHLLHSKLEEPGTTEDAGIAHSSLLKRLAASAGLAPQLPALEALAAADIRQMIVDPCGTVRSKRWASPRSVKSPSYGANILRSGVSLSRFREPPSPTV